MDKKQRDVLIKGFRLLRQGTAEGERFAHADNVDEVLVQLDTMLQLAAEMKKSIGLHIGAQAVLKGIEVKRPIVAAKIGRPKLSLVKG